MLKIFCIHGRSLCIQQLGQETNFEGSSLLVDSWRRFEGLGGRNTRFATPFNMIICLSVLLYRSNNHKDMVELRTDSGRIERLIALLENNNDNVISKVSLAFHLLRVLGIVGNQSGHMEHHFTPIENLIVGVFTSGLSLDIQSPSEMSPTL